MNLQDYGQIAVGAEEVGDAAMFMVEGATVSLAIHDGTPIGVELPASVELEVTFAEPAVKGDTRTGASKLVTTETGHEVQVPLFIEQGDRIRVETRTGDYQTRV
jgi:elongation factor P